MKQAVARSAAAPTSRPTQVIVKLAQLTKAHQQVVSLAGREPVRVRLAA